MIQRPSLWVIIDAFVLFILCLFVVGNVSKCEVNFEGTTKDVNLRQWPLNHLSKVGEYMNGYPLSCFLHSLMIHSVSIRLNLLTKRQFVISKKYTTKTGKTKVHNHMYTTEVNILYKNAKRPNTTTAKEVNLEQWPLNHHSKVIYELVSPIILFFC